MAEVPILPRTDLRADENVDNQLEDDQALLATLRARFLRAQEAESATRIEEEDDLRFANGQQWPTDIVSRRSSDNRPSLVINQMPQYLHQVTNEERQNRPAIRILPADDFADVDTAKVIQGMVRHIEVDSDADIAYSTAHEQGAGPGRGYFRIVTEYEDPMSFDQCIKIKRIRNRFTVYFDPSSQEFDGSDAMWCIIIEPMSRDVFRALYPDALPSSMQGWTSEGDGWVQRDEVRVAEYFLKVNVQREIVLLDDGTVHETRFLPDGLESRIVTRRQSLFPEIHWYKSNGYEVLEHQRFPGRYIPIIPVIGSEVDINGEVGYSGLVRHAKDSQRMYNYWSSSLTETIALAPRTPWVGAEGQFEGHEQEWIAANQRNIPYLEYKPTTHSGELVPPPQRNNFDSPIEAITRAQLLSREDIKATTGIYDASLGARSNETSGRAIIARQREGDVANYHYSDNLARSLRHAGRILVSIIPEIYSNKRVVRILGEDMSTTQRITLNAPFEDEEGIERMYDVRVGRYDVVVDVGPSFATKRQETQAAMLELTKVYPPLFEVGGDILIKAMDWPQAQELAERLQTLLPPELRPAAENANPRQQLLQLRKTVMELQQRLQAMNEYAKEVEAKAGELEQANVELTLSAQNKAGELAMKQQEADASMAIDQEKLAIDQARVEIERQQLELEEQRVALEVAKAQADMAKMQVEVQSMIAENDGVINLQNNPELLGRFEELAMNLTQLQAQYEALGERVEEDQDHRDAPKSVSVTRGPDGALIGTVTIEGGESRRIEIRPSQNGYVGAVE